MTTIAEIHTTQLTAACQKSVLLRINGRAEGTMPGAMYFGNLWHEAVRLCHERNWWHVFQVDGAVLDAHQIVLAKAKAENRPLTEAAQKNAMADQAECSRLLLAYAQRVLPVMGTMIGCEVPIRLTLDIDGEPQEFATHLDYLGRNANGLCVFDWKTGEESPTRPYLNRNLQFALLWLMVRRGEVLLDGFWTALEAWPQMTWVHVRNLNPYGRKTVAVDDNGEEREFVKGEARPINKILRSPPFTESGEAALLEELTTRVRMYRAGMFPTNPDPIGCELCESSKWCPSYAGEIP